MQSERRKPLVVITGASGDIGRSLHGALEGNYEVVGFDRAATADGKVIEVDLALDHSVEQACRLLRERHGTRIASVVHLAAYFDFTGEDNPSYEEVNVAGTRRLLRALQSFEVAQFIYASRMLVHRSGTPGERIGERTPIDPTRAYPKSKTATEQVVRDNRGEIPCVLLRLAGVYDEPTCAVGNRSGKPSDARRLT